MPLTIGEAREQWGWDIMKMAEDFASKVDDDESPFYVVYHCKLDKPASMRNGICTYRQTVKAYRERPKPMFGLLVWYADKKNGIFDFIPELSAPPDIPLDPKLLSEKAADASPRVMEQGEKLTALVS